jgi:hypothetical protein
MIRMSVTWLDSFRHYRDEDFMSLSDLLARLRGEEPPVPKMLAGRALHSILEHATEGELSCEERDGWVFTFASLDAAITLPPVRELKGSLSIQTPHGPVTLVGVIDGMDHEVRDYKLTERFEPDGYMEALQWRAYLWMFDARRFTYHAFVGDIDDTQKRVRVKEHHPLTLYRYPGMEDDVRATVCELAALIVRHAPDLINRQAA